MKYTYYTQGTCSSQIDFELDEQGVIRDVQFTGGCHGNLQGIRCGYKNTSCPDQLANGLRQALDMKN